MQCSLFLGAASTLSFTGADSLPFSPLVIALSHLAGLVFMLVVERRLASRTSGDHAPDDMELRERDQVHDPLQQLPGPSDPDVLLLLDPVKELADHVDCAV